MSEEYGEDKKEQGEGRAAHPAPLEMHKLIIVAGVLGTPAAP